MTAMASRMRTGSARTRHGQAGFTYVGMVILVAILGLVGAATLKIDGLLRRAAAEEELLFAGAAFADALTSYAAATPQGQPTQPPGLQDLLRDTRTPAMRRHLRKIYVDPMTNSTDWGIVWLADGKGVLAVYSKSQVQPLKIGNFDPRLMGFDGKAHIAEWRFAAAAPAPLVPQAAAPVKAATPSSLFPATAVTAQSNAGAVAPEPPVVEVVVPPPAEVPKTEPEAVAEDELQRQQDEANARRQRRE